MGLRLTRESIKPEKRDFRVDQLSQISESAFANSRGKNGPHACNALEGHRVAPLREGKITSKLGKWGKV